MSLREDAGRRLRAGIRAAKHGYIFGGAAPYLTSIDAVERYLDELDAKYPENAWMPPSA